MWRRTRSVVGEGSGSSIGGLHSQVPLVGEERRDPRKAGSHLVLQQITNENAVLDLERFLQLPQEGCQLQGETTERVWTDEDARTGKHALKIARTFHKGRPANTNRAHWRSWPPRMPVRPGQTVRASGWLKTPELGQRSSAGMMLEFYDAENKRLRDGMVRLGGQQIPHDWTEVTATTAMPVS